MKEYITIDNNNGVAELIEVGSNEVVGRFIYNIEKGQVHIEYPKNTSPKIIDLLNQRGLQFLKDIAKKKGMSGEIEATLDLEAHYLDNNGEKVRLEFAD